MTKKEYSICFVSNQLSPLDKNGGIGTAVQYTAEYLAKTTSLKISICYQPLSTHSKSAINNYSLEMKSKNIGVILATGNSNIHPPENSSRYKIYEILKQTEMDFYIFTDWLALGVYCFAAKESGIAFSNSKLGLWIHSSSLWCDRCNHALPASVYNVKLYDLEQACVEKADFLISPSQYLINWHKEEKHKLPAISKCIKNIVSSPELMEPQKNVSNTSKKPKSINRIVFFGRLEERKGVRVFIDSINMLSHDILNKVSIDFLGSCATYSQSDILNLIDPTVRKVTNEINFYTNYNSLQAREYLLNNPCVAVMPSLADNSPCVIYECLELDIPIIISNIGGGKELIHENDRDRVCFTPNPTSLIQKLEDIFSIFEWQPAIASWNHSKIIDDWKNTLDECIKTTSGNIAQEKKAKPLVSLVLTHYNRASLLPISFNSLLDQDYNNKEILIVDDGSNDEDAIEYLNEIEFQSYQCPVKVIRQNNSYLGAARNRGIREAKGEYIVFLDDDNVAHSDMVSKLVRAVLHNDADSCTCSMRYLHKDFGAPSLDDIENPAFVFLGGNASNTNSIMFNTFGDATGIYRKKALLEIGGFHEVYKVTHEDWQMHAKLKFNGYNCINIPDVLFWYRVTQNSMIRVTDNYKNYQQSILPFKNAMPDSLRMLPEVLLGMTKELDVILLNKNYENSVLVSELVVNRLKRSKPIKRLYRLIPKPIRKKIKKEIISFLDG